MLPERAEHDGARGDPLSHEDAGVCEQPRSGTELTIAVPNACERDVSGPFLRGPERERASVGLRSRARLIVEPCAASHRSSAS